MHHPNSITETTPFQHVGAVPLNILLELNTYKYVYIRITGLPWWRSG